MSVVSPAPARCLLGALLLALFSSAPVAAQTADQPPLTLEQATTIAIDNNRLLKIKALEVAKVDRDVAALETRRRPHVDVRMLGGTLAAPATFTFKTGAFGTYPNVGPIPSRATDLTSGPRASGVLFGQISQPLTQLRTIGLGLRSLAVGRELAQEELRAQQHAVAYNIKRLYYGLFEAEGGLTANDDALTSYRELDRLVSAWVAQQVALPAEGLAVKTALAKQEQTGVVLRNTIATLTEQLNLQLGRDIDLPITSVPPALLTTFDGDVRQAQATAIDRRPEVRAARLRAQQADYEMQRTRSAARPEVSLAFSYLGFYNFDVLPTSGAILGVAAAWEPWDWGRRREEAAAKDRTRDQARLAIKEAEDSVRVEVSEKFRTVQEAAANLRVVELEQQTARETLRVAVERYRQDAALQRQTLEAQAASSGADQQYRHALATLWTARADFERAIGEGR